jgi:Uncharacterized conserved protein
MAKLRTMANIKSKVDQAELVNSELLKLIAATRAEKGCINYDLPQDNEDVTHFLFYENWDSRELWQQHMDTQHIKHYMTAPDGAVEEFTLNEMTVIA